MVQSGREGVSIVGRIETSGTFRSGSESASQGPAEEGGERGVGRESSGDVEAARGGEGVVEVIEEVVTVRYCGNCNVWRTPRMVHCYRCGHCMEVRRADGALSACKRAPQAP